MWMWAVNIFVISGRGASIPNRPARNGFVHTTATPRSGRVFPTVVSEEEIVNYVDMTKGAYISTSDMKEIEELYNTWPSYELKATPQTS